MGWRLLRVPLFSVGLWRVPAMAALLGQRAGRAWWPWGWGTGAAWLGWGARRSARRAAVWARAGGGTVLRLEDGFLRSYGTGKRFPALSLVVDAVGIYYDSTRPSALESMLDSPVDLLDGIAGDVVRAKGLVLEHRLSKYNHAADWAIPASTLRPFDPSTSSGQAKLRTGQAQDRPSSARTDSQRVLVIDQTAGDMSVTLGGANADTFADMLAAARAENPQATIYVKTHPEVTSGRKGGYLTQVQDGVVNGQRTVVLRHAINPLSLIEQMDRVYVVTSIMGFEALLAGKPVTVFGMPWYAGWGATEDRQTCTRRTRQRSVDELFAAAYFHYTRYLNPTTHQRGDIFDVMAWLVRQREWAARLQGPAGPQRLICVGLRRWKAAHLRPMLALDAAQVVCVPDAAAARRLAPRAGDGLVFWGATPPAGLAALAQTAGARLVRMEDGFVRSVGLGSDLIAPLSLVLDEVGIYFDPTRPSGLEQLLGTATFTPDELARAQQVRAFVVAHGVTKYNLEPRTPARWPAAGRCVVLVPGQVQDDASVRLGCTGVKTNLGLLQAARAARPDAFIVYKPHPDVLSGNRVGALALAQARNWADHVETGLSVVSCIEACDEVHTLTSLAGFDALLRGKRVVTYGQPFYAGWGLTQDMAPQATAWARRTRRLTLDQLVAGTLLRYPLYWDPVLKGYTTCEAVLHQLVQTRDTLQARGALEKLRVGWVRRQWRKLQILARAWLSN